MTTATEWSERVRNAAEAAQQFRGKGNEATLLRWWKGQGLGSTPGDFDKCVAILSKHPNISDPKRLCAWLHHQGSGLWPGQEAGGRRGRGRRHTEDVLALAQLALADEFARVFADVGADPSGLPDDDAVHARIEHEAAGIAALSARLAAGRLTVAAFVAKVMAALRAAAEDVGTFDDSDLDDACQRYAQHVVDDDASHRQLAAWGLGLAGGAIWSSYQRGKVDAEGTDSWWAWETVANPCPDCAAFADGSPYRQQDIPSFPGAGDTRCGGHCRCGLFPTDAPKTG